MTKKDVEKCLVRMWFVLTDHVNIIKKEKRLKNLNLNHLLDTTSEIVYTYLDCRKESRFNFA